MMWGEGTWTSADWLFMSVMMVLFWALVVGVAVLIVRAGTDRPGRHRQVDSSESVTSGEDRRERVAR
jgi:hypothetical protein